MKLHSMDIALWVLLCVAEAILALVILKKNAARRWPFLLALALFDLLHSALTAAYLHDYRPFFYIYWYGKGIRSLLTLGLLWDVARSMPILKYVPKRIGLVLFTFGLTVTIGAVMLTAAHHPNTAYRLTAEVLLVRECVMVAWMCFALSLLGSISLLGMGWTQEAVNVTGGVVISGVAAMIAASLTSSWPNHGHVIDQLQTAIEIAVLLSWSVTLCRTPLPDAPLSDSALNVVNELFEEQPLV